MQKKYEHLDKLLSDLCKYKHEDLCYSDRLEAKEIVFKTSGREYPFSINAIKTANVPLIVKDLFSTPEKKNKLLYSLREGNMPFPVEEIQEYIDFFLKQYLGVKHIFICSKKNENIFRYIVVNYDSSSIYCDGAEYLCISFLPFFHSEGLCMPIRYQEIEVSHVDWENKSIKLPQGWEIIEEYNLYDKNE